MNDDEGSKLESLLPRPSKKVVYVRMSPEAHAVIKQAAQRAGFDSLNLWALEVLIKEAQSL